MKRPLILLLTLIFSFLTGQESVRYSKRSETIKPFRSKFKDYTAVMLVDLTGGKIMYEENAFEVHEIASLTKMMSILLAAEEIQRNELSLDDTLETSTAASKIGGSQIYLKENEQMRVEDLLKAVIIKSANDATYVLGEKIGGEGKMDLFINMMNSRAEQLGMNETRYDFAHGLPPSKKDRAKNRKPNTSTCYDLVLLAEEMLKHPLIIKYSSVWLDYVREGKNKFELRNTSRLIKDYPYFDGLKTGFYDKAGFCIVASALKDNNRLVAVVLGSRSMKGRDKFINDLVTWGFSELDAERVPEPVADEVGHETSK